MTDLGDDLPTLSGSWEPASAVCSATASEGGACHVACLRDIPLSGWGLNTCQGSEISTAALSMASVYLTVSLESPLNTWSAGQAAILKLKSGRNRSSWKPASDTWLSLPVIKQLVNFLMSPFLAVRCSPQGSQLTQMAGKSLYSVIVLYTICSEPASWRCKAWNILLKAASSRLLRYFE